jgi:spermidine synthase
MALIWSHEEDGNRYEVRSAGASLRLYRNGVNHSQWNPNRPLSGSIWDLITLPALHRPNGTLRDALMLGFGAGTVGRQLADLAGVERVVGVELDPMHLSIAQGFFDCSESCELVAADAVEWVYGQGKEACYDLIIDDLYSEEEGVAQRCAPMDAAWFETLVDLLKPGGILVANMIEPEKVNALPPIREVSMRARLPHAIMYQIQGYENRVLAFSDEPFEKSVLVSALQSICRKYPRCHGVAKRYQFSRL